MATGLAQPGWARPPDHREGALSIRARLAGSDRSTHPAPKERKLLAQAEPGAGAADGVADTFGLPDRPAGLFLMVAPATTIFAPADPGCDGTRRSSGCDHEKGHPMPAATARPDHGTTAPVIRARSRLARLASTPVPAIRLTPPLLRTAGGTTAMSGVPAG